MSYALEMAQPPKCFCYFMLLGSIGNQQRVGFWRNVKKVKITAPYWTHISVCDHAKFKNKRTGCSLFLTYRGKINS
jgi:hypothetical protein